MPRGEEKREHDRVSNRVTLKTITSDFGTIEMETDNLSVGGAYCLSSQRIPPMTKLRLNIFLPSSDGRSAHLHFPIEVDAVVVRSEETGPEETSAHAYRLALFFSTIADKDREVLGRYLESSTRH